MNLRIVPKRFEMSHAFHWSLNRLLIYDISLAESDQNSETLFHNSLQNFGLHLAHELNVNLLRLFHPHDMKLRFFLLELTHIAEHRMYVAAVRKLNPISEHRFEYRQLRVLLDSDALSRIRPFQSGHCAHCSCARTLRHLKLLAGIDADLIHLSIHTVQRFLHIQYSAGHFQISQAVSLGIPRDLVHLCAEFLRIYRTFHIALKTVQKFLDSLRLKR